MLNVMRKSAQSPLVKYFVFGLLMAGALGLALSGGYNFGGSGGGRNTIATIGNDKLDARVFDQIVSRTLAQQGLDKKTAYAMGYIDQILAAQTDNILMSRATRDLGLNISDDMVTAQVKRLLEPLTANGVSAKDALRTILRNQNLSESQLMEEVRSEMGKTLLRNALQIGTAVPSDDETKDIALYSGEKRSVDIVFLPDAAVKDYKAPTDDVLKPFYESGQKRYAVPETRSFTVALLSAKSKGELKTVTDEQLKKTYEEQKDSFALPERRMLDQAIFDSEDKAKAAAEETKKGKSLKEAVKAVTGNDSAYSGAQLYQRDGLDKGIAAAAFDVKAGTVAGPVQTPLGWHVMVVKDIKAPSVQSFDDVKDQLRKEATADNADEALYSMSTQLDDALAGGATLEDAAKTYNLEMTKIGPVHQDGSTPDKHDGMKDFKKDSAAILTAAFNLSEGETSSVISLTDGRYAAIRLDSVKAKSYKPFDEVKADLSKLWIADQQAVLNKQKAEDSLKKLKDGSMTLDALAKSSNATIQNMNMERSGKAAAPMNDQAKMGFFMADKDSFVLQPVKDGILVGRVKSVTIPSDATVPQEQLKKISDASLQGTQNEIMDVYLAEQRKKHKVKINRDRLAEMYENAGSDNGAGDMGGDQ